MEQINEARVWRARSGRAYKAIVFDLDGTLVDSVGALRANADRYLTPRGLPGLSLEEARGFIGHGVRHFVARMAETRGLPIEGPDFETTLSDYKAIYAAAPGEDNPPFPGVEEALVRLAEAGLPLGMCTNKPGAPTESVLKAWSWQQVFAVVVAGDTLAVTKPDPGPLLHCAEALSVAPEELLYIGDSEVDAATAANAGVDFALYLHGYRKAAAESLETRYLLDDFADLPDLVLG